MEKLDSKLQSNASFVRKKYEYMHFCKIGRKYTRLLKMVMFG